MVRATKLGHLCEWRWAEPRTREHLENRNRVSLDFHPPLHSSTSFPHLCKGVSTWSRCEFLLNKSCRVENKWKNYLFSNLWKTMLKAGRTFYFTPLSRVKEDGLIRGRRRGLEDTKRITGQGCWMYLCVIMDERGLSEGWLTYMSLSSPAVLCWYFTAFRQTVKSVLFLYLWCWTASSINIRKGFSSTTQTSESRAGAGLQPQCL